MGFMILSFGYSKSYSQLDLVPTWMSKLCIIELLPIIMTIMKTSGQFLGQFKDAIIRPLLKVASRRR